MPLAERSRSWSRLAAVDLMRGLAILFVLMNHVNMRLWSIHLPYTQGLPPQLVSSLVWNGQRGVQMFFAISGFLITATTLRRWGTPGRVNVRQFYQLRFARIAPLLLALLAVLSALHLLHVHNFVVAAKTGGLVRALLAALTFHINVLEATRGYLPGNWDILWSLSVEEVFYLAFPVVCVLLGRSGWFVALLCALVVVGPFGRTALTGGNEVWQEYSYLGGMDAIALGCLTALFTSVFSLSRRTLRGMTALGSALLVFGLCFTLAAARWGLQRSGLDMTIIAMGTCLIAAAAAQMGWQSPRVLKPLLILGLHSYEIYLTHMFVVYGAFEIFRAAGAPMPAVPFLFVSVIVAAAFVGAAVARFYSEPLNKALRRHWGEGPNRLGSMVESDGQQEPATC